MPCVPGPPHYIMCFRCIYACQAHTGHSANFRVLKVGYDLNAVEKRMQAVELEPVEQGGKDWLLAGIRN